MSAGRPVATILADALRAFVVRDRAQLELARAEMEIEQLCDEYGDAARVPGWTAETLHRAVLARLPGMTSDRLETLIYAYAMHDRPGDAGYRP